jgi:hypothetical protein
MALTLDGIVPNMGVGGSSMGSGVGLGAVGGGVAGLILGSLLGSNGNGLFGGGGNNTANVAEFSSLNNQIQTLQAQVGANDLRNEMESMENTFASISSGQTAANAANFNNLGSQVGQVQTALAAGNFTTLQSINDLGRDVTAQSNQNALQQLNSFNQLNTTTLQGFNQAAFNQNVATQQIIAQGVAQAAAMAQCCCEIKAAISTDGQATRSLINDLNVQNLRDQLAAANNKVSNNEQNQYLLNTILTHITPTATV